MRTSAILTICLALSSLAAAGTTQEGKAAKPPEKGDTLEVKGCLSGGALEATEAEALDMTGLLAAGLTFRLTGDKALLKEMREKHDRRIVSVSGVLKSDLPQAGGSARTLGGVRIAIGGAEPSPNSPRAESRRAVPVLEVKSFDGGATSCGR